MEVALERSCISLGSVGVHVSRRGLNTFSLGGLLGAFFSLFVALGRFLGDIVVRSRVWERFLAIWSRFLEVLEGFGEGFGRVLRVFFDDFSQYHRK